jgi:hypothetical protein
MDEHATKIFMSEIAVQANNALHAKKCLDEAVARGAKAGELFRDLENFLNSATKVSLLLWPPRPPGRARGEHLRQCLKLDDGNPLELRDARNHLQHFDERLDDWAATTTNGNIVDGNVGPLSMYRLRDTPVLRNYDPSKQVFTFRSDDFDIVALAAALEKVMASASSFVPHLKSRL